MRTPLGRMSNAVRDNADRLQFIGYQPRNIRFMIFIASGSFGGLAGGMAAVNYEIITPESLGLIPSGLALLMAAVGGLGGCPFAPGASGNVVTEDLVFMFESMGVDTGIDLEALMATRDIVSAALPGEELYGFTPRAGLPLGFKGAPVPAAAE